MRGWLSGFPIQKAACSERVFGGYEMINFIMESVVISFAMGGIFGAVVALLLTPGKQLMAKEALIYNSKNERSHVRRR